MGSKRREPYTLVRSCLITIDLLFLRDGYPDVDFGLPWNTEPYTQGGTRRGLLAPLERRSRHPNGAGTARPRRRQHHDDVPPRAEPGRAGRPQSVRPTDWPPSTATDGMRSERRDWLRAAAANRVRSAAAVPILNRFRSVGLPRSGARPFSGVSCRQPRLTPGLAAHHIALARSNPSLVSHSSDTSRRASIRRIPALAASGERRSAARGVAVPPPIGLTLRSLRRFLTRSLSPRWPQPGGNITRGLRLTIGKRPDRSASGVDFRAFWRDTSRQWSALAANKGRRSTQ